MGEPRDLHCRSEADHAGQSHQAATAMTKINIDVFEYADADWDKIVRVVENAGLSTGSRRGQFSLREHVTMVVIKHIALTTIFTSPTQRARIRQLEALAHTARRFYEKLVAALSTDFSFPGGGTRYEQRRLHSGVDDDCRPIGAAYRTGAAILVRGRIAANGRDDRQRLNAIRSEES